MKDTNKLNPEIRFSGFTDDWEQRKLFDVVEIGSGMDYKHLNEGDVPVYGTGGYMLSVDAALSDDKDAIGIGRKGTIDKPYILRAPFWTVDTLFYCIPKIDYDLDFTNCLFQNINWKKKDESTGVPSLSKVIINNVKTATPTLDEQQKIGEYFSNLDRLITLHQRKLDKLKTLKKAMLEKMFPKNGESVPEIRFSGFTDDWEQRKLGEAGTARSGVGFPDAEQGGIEGIPFFKVSDMNIEGNENELVVANNYVTAEQINRKKWNVINDVPAIFFAKVGAAVMLNRKRLVRFPFLLDNNTMAYVFNKNVWNCDFGKTLFETLDLTKLTQVGALPSYNASDVENVRINIPNKNEQQKIGEYFSNLDHLITLHQRKLDKLKTLKKAMLEKMFI